MKLQLLHGPAINISRTKLVALKKSFNSQDVIVFEEGADIDQILGSLATLPLFANPRLIILENPPEDLSLDSSLNVDQTSLILWFDHEVSEKKPIIESIKILKGEILFFPEAKEASIFPFLDYLATKDKKAFLEIDKLKKAGFDIQYFIIMVFYLLRNLVVIPKNAPQFVKNKLERQRKNFNLEKITSLYKNILEVDFKIKSGLLEKDQAEFVLINHFLNFD